MKSEHEIANEVVSIEDKTISEVLKLLSEYNGDIRDYLAYMTGALCGVCLESVLKDTKHIDVVHARWLFWYAYRYMTGESFESISQRTRQWHKFDDSSISVGVTKMSMLISQNTIWTKRWVILKKIIKVVMKNHDTQLDLFPSTVVVKVTHPKGVNIEIKDEEEV